MKGETERSIYREIFERAFFSLIVASVVIVSIFAITSIVTIVVLWVILSFMIYGHLNVSYKLSTVEKRLSEMEESNKNKTIQS